MRCSAISRDDDGTEYGGSRAKKGPFPLPYASPLDTKRRHSASGYFVGRPRLSSTTASGLPPPSPPPSNAARRLISPGESPGDLLEIELAYQQLHESTAHYSVARPASRRDTRAPRLRRDRASLSLNTSREFSLLSRGSEYISALPRPPPPRRSCNIFSLLDKSGRFVKGEIK